MTYYRPRADLALGIAFLALTGVVLVVERRGRIDAPGSEAGLASLFLWGAAACLGALGAITIALAWWSMA